MMAFILGHVGHAAEEVDAGHEVFHHPILANPLAFVRQAPAGQGAQLVLGFVEGVFGHAPFTGDAFLLRELLRGLSFHDSLPTAVKWLAASGRWLLQPATSNCALIIWAMRLTARLYYGACPADCATGKKWPLFSGWWLVASVCTAAVCQPQVTDP